MRKNTRTQTANEALDERAHGENGGCPHLFPWTPNSSSLTVNTAHLTPGAYFVRLTDGTQKRTARLTVLEQD